MSDGAVRYLPPLVGLDEGTRGTVTNHRMREVTEQVAQRGIWNSGLLTEVRDLFDSLAPGWTATRDHPARNALYWTPWIGAGWRVGRSLNWAPEPAYRPGPWSGGSTAIWPPTCRP